MLTLRAAGLVLLSSSLLLGATAQAQLLDAVKSAVGGGSSSGGVASSALGGSLPGALGGAGGGMPALDSVGTGNLAGVLTYCARNKYLGGADASSVQNQLIGKLGGPAQAKSDPGYQQGLKGILGGDSGQKMDLAGGGSVQQQIRDAACEQVLKYGKSLL